MNRFIFGRGWVYQEEAGDDAAGAGGGGAGGDVGAADDAAGGAAADDDAGAAGDGTGEQGAASGEKKSAGAAPGEKKGEQPADMKSAIDVALGYAKKPDAAVDDKTKAKPDAAAEEKHANGKPKKNEKGEDLDAEGKVVPKQAPKAKTSAELALSKEQLAVLKPEARARFHEMSSALKAHEGTITTLSGENKVLKEARDSLLGVMQETKTTHDQLASYLEFNAMLQSSNPKDWEEALQFVENQRAALYKALGREPQGGEIDLLKDFPDLSKQVATRRSRAPRRSRSPREDASAPRATRRRSARSSRSASRRLPPSSASRLARPRSRESRRGRPSSRAPTLTTRRKKIDCLRNWTAC
jgi:hypothetical protein